MLTAVNTRSVTTSAFVALATLGFMSLGGSNKASANVLSCEGTSFNSVVSCCEEMSRVRRPGWMIEAGTSCAKVAKCKVKRRCGIYLDVVFEDSNHKDKSTSRKRR